MADIEIKFKNGSVIKLNEKADTVPVKLNPAEEHLVTKQQFFRLRRLLEYTDAEIEIQWQTLKPYNFKE